MKLSHSGKPTWREKIREAADAVDASYVFRARVFTEAHEAGLSLRQIAEAAEMSHNAVYQAIGRRAPRRSLDDPVGESSGDH